MTYSKTAALKLAAEHVHLSPIGNQYQVIYPVHGISGTTSAGIPRDYFGARAERAETVAMLALKLMGYPGDDADEGIHRALDAGYASARAIVECALKTCRARAA